MNSLVNFKKIEKDPRNLAYFFPTMNVVKYAKLSNEFFYWKTLKLAEDIAKVNGLVLVPAECIHWQRKKELYQRMIMIFKRSFYMIAETEMTKTEKKKYKMLLDSKMNTV